MLPNQSPEPTAVGAVRSAVAVHVTSRRWLSFFVRPHSYRYDNRPAKATMIAAGIMAVGAITVALINKKASDKPMIPKAKAAPVVSVWREIWPSVLV